MPRVTCEKCGTSVHKRALKKHQTSKKCHTQMMTRMMGNVMTNVDHMSGMIQTLSTQIQEVREIASRPQIVYNTINQYIIATKEPLSLTAIEASVALGMQPSVLRDGAQGIAQFVVTENKLPKKIHIADKSRYIAKYMESTCGEVITDKGCEEILNHIFVKFGRDGEILVDRLSGELEKYMTEQNENGSWVDDFYNQQMSKLGKLRLEWKKASEGHTNKLRKDVAKAIVRRCQ